MKGYLWMLLTLLVLGGVSPMRAEADSSFREPLQAKESQALSGNPFGIAWGFLYGPPLAKPETFVPLIRNLGGGSTKVYLFWGQIEPEKGHYDWRAVDAFLHQLKTPEEGLLALFSSSPWATRLASPLLPPSPAKNLDEYYRFVHALVQHCKGHIRYWQNDSEPNNPIYWAGNEQEFVAQLKVFYKAVKDADPKALVVCGGYDGLFNPPGLPPKPGQEHGLAFFDYVLKEGVGFFDVFDLRLYADPYSIPVRVAVMRQKMQALGYSRPIICTEYNGPGFFDFPINRQYAALINQWTASITTQGTNGGPGMGEGGKNGVAELYAKRASLAPQTQLFLEGGSPELEQKFARLQCRDLVMRNVLALSADVQKTMYWDLWHDTSKRDNLMTLMFGKHKMMDYADGDLKKIYPVADTFRLMTASLQGVERVRQITISDHPALYLFEAQRRKRGPVYIVWEKRDALTGEDAPPTDFVWPWKAPTAKAVDALGHTVAAKVENGHVSLPVSLTPIFLEPTAFAMFAR